MFYGALAGMVSGVDDPYSVFFDPEASKEFMSEINGNFDGIGAEIGLKDEEITVIAPIAGSPAETAGLRADDHILAIDSADTASMTVNDAVSAIRGDKGTNVTLIVERDGEAAPISITITRDTIHIDSVKSEMVTVSDKKLAVITVTHFNSDTTAKFQEAMNAVLLEQPAGVVLDLRNNPGGYLDAAVDMVSKFLPEGSTVLYEQSSDQTQKPYNTSGASPLEHMPTVVLINGGSASASEIVSGALQDTEAATLIGETSYGKGTVQNVENFDDGSTLKLTVARWLTPNKHQIDKVGIHPDYEVVLTNDDYANKRDPQLDAAKLFLTDRTTFDSTYQRTIQGE
jgi:carboxyl-terminal processing protease